MPARSAPDLTYVYFGDVLDKRRDDAGNLLVYGKAAGDDLDLDAQILDPDWLAGAVPEWFDSGANVRLSHDMHRPVGKGTEHEVKSDGHWLMSKVVDSDAQRLVDEDVLTGYSVGIKNPRIRKDARAPNGRIVGGQIIEISLVDRPANPTCVLTLAKSAEKDPSITLPPGITPVADKGLVRTEELLRQADGELVKVSTSAGHTHMHVHEDGAHSHAHPHSPLDGHFDHGDGTPHEHAHDPKDPPRVEDSGAEDGGDDAAAKAAAQTLLAPTFDAGPQAPEALHQATVAKMEKQAAQVPQATAGAPVTLTLEALQIAVDAAVAKAMSGVEKQAKKDPSDPHAFVDDDGDGKCDSCGEKRDAGMHHRSFGNGDKKMSGADLEKALADVLTKDVPDDPKLERCITDLYDSDDMKARYPDDKARKSRSIAICRASLGKALGAELHKGEASTAEINDLPDSAFAFIKEGGTKDDQGKTVPRDLRMLPIHAAAHVRNALARLPQTKGLSADDKASALSRIKTAAKKFGVEVSDDGKVAASELLKLARRLLHADRLLTKQDDGIDGGGTGWDGDQDHHDAYAQACRGLATLIQQEADELADGDDEYWSLYCLLQAVSGLRSYLQGEISEGELEGPLTNGRPMYYGAEPDLVKVLTGIQETQRQLAEGLAQALNPPIVVKAPQQGFDPSDFAATLHKELATAMKPLEGIEALGGRMAKVEETVERIAKAPVPPTPRRAGISTNGPAQSSPADAHREKAAYYMDQAASMSDPTMAQGFRGLATDELARAAALDRPATT